MEEVGSGLDRADLGQTQEVRALAALGKLALESQENTDSAPELQQFNAAIATYSLNRMAVDWAQIERVGSALAARRRDLKLYSYLALAVFQGALGREEAPYPALAAVLRATSELIEKGWERCLPSTPARRQAQLKWLSEELAGAAKARAPRPAEARTFLDCMAAAEQLGEISGQALGLGYPLLRELREVFVAQRPEPLPEPKPEPKPAMAAPPPQPAAAPAPQPAPIVQPAAVVDSPPPAPAAQVSVAEGAPAELPREALEDRLSVMVVELAAQLRADSLTDPASYWMLRALRWANHALLRPESLQEVAANKYKTQLPLPPGHKLLSKQIPALLAAGQHATALSQCEELFGSHPMWLELQRWGASALEALGAQGARLVVRNQVSLLLSRCPALARFRFGDREGTPFADGETAAWLEREQGQAAAPTADREPQPSRDVMPEGLMPGVQFLQKQIEQASSGRRRFELRLHLVELLLANDRSDVAWPICERMLGTLESQRLRTWEPELCKRTLKLAVQAAQAAETGADCRVQLWAQLSIVGPELALLAPRA